MLSCGAVRTWADARAEMQEAGLRAGSRPAVTMPVFTIPKPSSTPEDPKFRFVHDCRWLNEFLIRKPFKLEQLKDFVKLLSRGDRLISIDFSSAYWHIPIALRCQTLLGFNLDGVDYVFGVLPFGLRSSAAIFSHFARVTATALRASGLVTALIAYMDDLGISIGPVRDDARVKEIVAFVAEFGWLLNEDKLVLDQDTSLDLLGFDLCTTALDIGATARRLRKLKVAVAGALARPARMRVRSLCSICGQIQSMQLAYGIKCRIRSRYLLLAVRLALADSPDYDAFVAPGARALEELELWGADIDTSARQPMHVHLRRPDFIIECDASDSALAGIVVQAPEGVSVGGQF